MWLDIEPEIKLVIGKETIDGLSGPVKSSK